MRTLSITLFAGLIVSFSSCMKHAEDNNIPGYGAVLNTWTFFDGSKNYFGNFWTNPVLDTTIQSNNTYTLDMTGIERGSGQVLTMAISLSDLDFAIKAYQSGVMGSNHSTSFYYTGSISSRDPIFFSTNNDPGAVMTYTISSYEAVNKIVTIVFNGQAFDPNGKLITISKGKLMAKIDLK